MKQLLALFMGLSLAFGTVAAEPAKKAEPAMAEAKKAEPAKAGAKTDANKAKKECKMEKDPKTGVEKEKCRYPKKDPKK